MTEDNMEQLTARLKRTELNLEQLQAECRQLRNHVELAEKALGEALAGAGERKTEEIDDTLEDNLIAYTEDWLKETMEDFHLSNKGKKKEEMVHELAGYLLMPANMREELFWYSEEELDALERLIEIGRSDPIAEDKENLDEFWNDIGYVTVYTDETYQVPSDVAQVYNYIRNTGYRNLHRQILWLRDCLETFVRIYVAAPAKILHRMFRRETELRLGFKEFLKLLDEVPEDMNPCQIIDGNVISKEYVSVCSFERFESLLFDGIEYYIPTREEIQEYAKNGYPFRQRAYQELWSFANTDLKHSAKSASKLCATMWQAVFDTGFLQDIRHISQDSMVNFPSEELAEKFSDIMKRVNANTRMPFLKGHTQSEMTGMGFLPMTGIYPVVTRNGRKVSVTLMDMREYHMAKPL